MFGFGLMQRASSTKDNKDNLAFNEPLITNNQVASLIPGDLLPMVGDGNEAVVMTSPPKAQENIPNKKVKSETPKVTPNNFVPEQ
jgi:hypothetical protein